VELIDGQICKDFTPQELGIQKSLKFLETHACTMDE
jgi:hypothetical protein